MSPLVLDTNALISFVTDRDPVRQGKVAVVFERAARAEANLLCPQNVLTEFVCVMQRVYGIGAERISTMIADLLDLPGVAVVNDLEYARLLAL